MELCGICGVASGLKCSKCNKQVYCGKPHQRQHWPEHRIICIANANKPLSLVEEKQNASFGRHLSAVSDTNEETILFKDTAIVVGPPSGSPPVCLGCLRLEVLSSCRQCGAPMCHPGCKHSVPECDAIQKGHLNVHKHYDCILPLRCLLNVRSPKERWKEFLKLEAHLDVRRHLPVWLERQVRVVEVLKNHGIAASDGSEDELIQRICGILDVNSFEVRGLDGGILRAVFPQAALMSHSCIANVHVAVDDNFLMTVRAATRIQQGETLFYCYTSVLQDTAARQEHLWEGKYFRCQCTRCKDPSELGTHVGSIWCPRCTTGLVTPGLCDKLVMSDIVARAKNQRQQAYRQFPLNDIQWRPCKGTIRSPKLNKENQNGRDLNVDWQCSDCKHLFPHAMVRAVYQVSMDTVDAVTLSDEPNQTSDRLEKVVKKLECTLPPQHAVILHAKQLLGGAYREQMATAVAKTGTKVASKLLGKSTDLYRELAAVLEKLERGAINRNIGITLHCLYEPLLLTLLNRNAKGAEAVKGLSEIRDVLVTALRHLRVEPPESPEGRLVAAALRQLADVEDRLENAQQYKSNKSRRKKK